MDVRLRHLATGPRYTGLRVARAVALWISLAAMAEALGPVAWLPAAVMIGFLPMHDLLVQGHEATHLLAARGRRANAAWLWFCHAVVGVSGRAYRAFHLQHHAHTHTEHDPEAWFYDPARGRPTGWGYLRIVWMTHPMVNTWFRRSNLASGRQVAVDLGLAGLLHAALIAGLGPGLWLRYVLLPMFTGLGLAVVLRALTEHHGAATGNPFHATRATRAHPVLQWLWSNVDHHLEHHLAPYLPCHALPAARRELTSRYQEEGVTFDDGLVPTALRLLTEPEHFAAAQPDPIAPFLRRDLGHELKVLWFRDILACGPARRHLYSLYFHGEAYEQLHPLGVWVDRLDPRWGRKLRRQLDDENRHAERFAALLAAEGALPTPVAGLEDVGWSQLHRCVPDVCAAAGQPERFNDHLTARYLGFLHALESRSIGDLHALGEAADLEGVEPLAHTVRDILVDERVHAVWTWRALCRLTGSADAARALYEPIRRAEARGSEQILLHLLPLFEQKGAGRGARRLRWGLMKLAARLGAAVAPLPRLAFHAAPGARRAA